jgi:hypothetical protein
MIRRRVAATAATLFIALFSTIYVQMAAGSDPVIGTGSQTAQATTTSGTASSGTTSTSSGSSGSSTSSSQSSAPMTTSAS